MYGRERDVNIRGKFILAEKRRRERRPTQRQAAEHSLFRFKYLKNAIRGHCCITSIPFIMWILLLVLRCVLRRIPPLALSLSFFS